MGVLNCILIFITVVSSIAPAEGDSQCIGDGCWSASSMLQKRAQMGKKEKIVQDDIEGDVCPNPCSAEEKEEIFILVPYHCKDVQFPSRELQDLPPAMCSTGKKKNEVSHACGLCLEKDHPNSTLLSKHTFTVTVHCKGKKPDANATCEGTSLLQTHRSRKQLSQQQRRYGKGGYYGGYYRGYYGRTYYNLPATTTTSTPGGGAGDYASWKFYFEKYQKETGVNDADDEPSGTPHKTMCSYSSSSLEAVIATACDQDSLIHEKVNKAVPAGYTPLDAAMTIIKKMKEQPSNKFFANPNLERDLTMAEDAFGLIDAGHSSLLPNGALGKMMKAEGIERWSDFKSTVKSWSKGNTKNMKKLGLAIASGALDVVANFAGPLGAGLSMVGAVLNFWETNSLDKQLQQLSEKLLTEVAKMVDRNAAQVKTKEIEGWLSAFTSEMGFVSSAVQQLAKEKIPEAGMHQFALLNALQADLATTRYQWMPYRDAKGTWQGGDMCQAPHAAIHHMGHPCVALRNTLAFTVPTLATMHLTLIDMMISAVGPRTNIVKSLKKKFFDLVVEYYQYFNKFRMSYCSAGTNQWSQSDSNENNHIIVCSRQRDTFIRKWSSWNTHNPPSVRFGFFTMCCRGTRQKFIEGNPCGCANPNSHWNGRDYGLAQVNSSMTAEELQDFDPRDLADQERDWPGLNEEEAVEEPLDHDDQLELVQINEERIMIGVEKEIHNICGDHFCLHDDITPQQHANLKALSKRVLQAQVAEV